MVRRLGGAIAFALGLCALSPAAGLATVTVATTNDSVPGSLREAIEEAPPGETIVVPAGTYTLTGGELSIGKTLTVQGAGAGATVVTAGGASRVFAVSGAESVVKITGMTIRDGVGQGSAGGIAKAQGALTLEGVTLTENLDDASGAPGKLGGIGRGGAIYSKTGPLTVVGSTISANRVTAAGGEGSLGGIAYGAGLYSEGPFTIRSTTFNGNVTEAPGGQKPATPGQNGGDAFGGAIYGSVSEGASEGAVELAAVTFSANTATAAGGPGENPGGLTGGGAIYLSTEGIAVMLSGLTVSGNRLLAPAGSAGSAAGQALGGGLALFVTAGSATLTNATVTANQAASPTGTGGQARGGGIAASSATTAIQIVNTTLDANAAETQGGGKGGDLYSVGSTRLVNTIVSAGVAEIGAENCSPAVESLGHNIDSRDQCGLHATGDKVNTDPLLGPLAANGGPLLTQAITPASPAANAGANSGCPGADARGVLRPQGPACEIGAFELAPPSAATSAASGVAPAVATLHGSGSNPDVVAGTILFQYGTTPTYGSQTTPAVLAAGASAAPASAPLSGLKAATTYHFRAVASTPEGTAFGADQTFTTAPARLLATAPVLSSLRISPQSLKAMRGKGASIAAARRGARISYADSQAARTTFTVQRAVTGFRVGRSCKARAPRHHHGKVRHCTRLVAVGAFAHTDAAGAVKLHFTGRVGGRALRPGRYRLTAVARNAAGLRSRPALAAFRVTR